MHEGQFNRLTSQRTPHTHHLHMQHIRTWERLPLHMVCNLLLQTCTRKVRTVKLDVGTVARTHINPIFPLQII